MKNFKKLIVLIMISTFFTSCQDDGGDSVVDFGIGGVPDMVKISSLDGFINLNELILGNDVQFGYSIDIARGDVSSADVIAFYRKADGTLYGPNTLSSGINTFPTDFTLSQADLVSNFSEITSTDDIELADALIISAKLYLANGTEINMLNDDGTRNYGSDIHTSTEFSAQISFPVSCPSDLAGNYVVVSSGFSTDGAPVNNPLVNFAYNVTLTDNGGGSYTISDGVAGVYQDWYCAPYGYCFETPGNFTDVCGSLAGSWVEAFGCQVDLTGIVNADGTLTIQWINCFGDEITEAIYTPQ